MRCLTGALRKANVNVSLFVRKGGGALLHAPYSRLPAPKATAQTAQRSAPVATHQAERSQAPVPAPSLRSPDGYAPVGYFM